jgi:two-component system chemotaxis response regulator CheB
VATAGASRVAGRCGQTLSKRPPVRVLVVDDSALVRQAMRALLVRDGEFEVEVAADPLFAEPKAAQFRPDVVVLDLEMPRMDGLTWLRQRMRSQPIPVVICSALADRFADAALRALDEGAVEVVTKPQIGVRDFLEHSASAIRDAVRAAAAVGASSAWRRRWGQPLVQAAPARAPTVFPTPSSAALIAMGASTGGPEALRIVLEAMPEDAPPIVIVQHMPQGFTAAFARRLDESCKVSVREAQSGDRLRPGLALVARGDHHLLVHRVGGIYVVELGSGPAVTRHRPSVDVLFRSVAEAAGPNAVAVLLTGMGADGAEGMLALRRAGAATIAQDQPSSVVFGMPREAIERGAVESILPIERIAAAVLERTAVNRRV